MTNRIYDVLSTMIVLEKNNQQQISQLQWQITQINNRLNGDAYVTIINNPETITSGTPFQVQYNYPTEIDGTVISSTTSSVFIQFNNEGE